MQNIKDIKDDSARYIYQSVLNTMSSIVMVLEGPCMRSNNRKAKVICAVKDMEHAEKVIRAVNERTEEDNLKINALAKRNNPAIRYSISVVNLMDPVVRISVKRAEKVYRVEQCMLMQKLGISDKEFAIDKSLENPDASKEQDEKAEYHHFLELVRERADTGEIDLKSIDSVRIACKTGTSYRIQAYVEPGKTMQQNVGDICILVYPDPELVKVISAPRRRTRSDAYLYDPIVETENWSLSRYLNDRNK